MNSHSRNHQGQQVSDRNLRDYIALVFRGRWTILISFATMFLISLLYTQLAERTYRAIASIRIDIKQFQSSLFREQSNVSGNLNIIQNEIQILKSNSLSETAAKRLVEIRYLDPEMKTLITIIKAPEGGQPGDTIAQTARISAAIRGMVDFEPVRESDVIKITATSKDPREAALIANTYAESYFRRNVYASRTKSRSFREFLESQMKEKQQDLAKSEETLRKFMEAKGVVSLDDESKKVIEQLSQLEAQRDAADISIQALEKTLSSYKDQVAQQEVNVAKVMGEANDPYIRLLQDQLAQLEVQRDITVAQNPAYVGKEVYNAKLNEIEGQIQALRAKLKKRTDDFLVNLLPGSDQGSNQRDPAGYLKQVKQKMLEATIELQSLQARKKALIAAIQDYNRQFEHLPKKNMEYARLQRDKLSLEKLYLTVEEKYNEANIVEQGEIGYIDIFDPAVPPGGPSSPKVMISLFLGSLFGLGLGLAIVFVREYLDEKIRKPEDLKKRGLKSLAVIMEVTQNGHKSVAKDGVQSQVELVGLPLSMLTLPLSPVAESYRHLRAAIMMSPDGKTPRSIMVTSPEPGEGKSTTVSNLAIAIAQAGKKTLLIDGDLRRPSIHTAFGLPLSPGFTEVLQGKTTVEKVVHTSRIPGLQVLTSGTLPSSPSDCLNPELLRGLLAELGKKYDILLFDTPPVLAVTDTSILAGLVDRVVMVVSAGKTSFSSLSRATEMLEGVGVKVTGVVLNNLDFKQAYGLVANRSGYGYYGYSYGARESEPDKISKDGAQSREQHT